MISQIELMRLSGLTNRDFARQIVPSGKMTVDEIRSLAVVSEDMRRAADEFARNNPNSVEVKMSILGKLAALERWSRMAYVAYRYKVIARQHPLLTKWGIKAQANMEFYRFWRAGSYTTAV